MTETTPDAFVLGHYQELIGLSHPKHANIWPLISGHDCRIGSFQDWLVIIFTHTGNSGIVNTNGIGELPEALIGSNTINAENKELVRSKIEKHFALQPQDGVVFMLANRLENSELMALMHRHELALGLAPIKFSSVTKAMTSHWFASSKRP